MELSVFNIEGVNTGRTIQLNDEVFNLEAPNEHAIYMDVKHIHANGRQGTHKTKGRAEVNASTRKLYRQKGTGNARAGSRKSPIRKSGGTIFGPSPRDYSFRLNKKIKSLARRSALTFKAREEGIKVLENFKFDAPRTKAFVSILEKLELSSRKVLLITADYDTNIFLSGRNLPKTQVLAASEVNTIHILGADAVLVTEGAVNFINERFAN